MENGLPLIRCSNNGLSGWADSRGSLREVLRDEHGAIYGAGFLTAEVPLLGVGEKRAPTFYHEHGDWFGWVCVAIGGIMVMGRSLRWRSSRQRRKSLSE